MEIRKLFTVCKYTERGEKLKGSMHEGAENKGLWKPQIITKHAQTIDVGNRKLKYVFIVYIYKD